MRPQLRRTSLSAASKARKQLTQCGHIGAGEGWLRPPSIPLGTRAPAERAGGGLAPLPGRSISCVPVAILTNSRWVQVLVALSTWKCFQQPVGDAAHLSNRIVDHAVSISPRREANRNVQPTVGLMRIVE